MSTCRTENAVVRFIRRRGVFGRKKYPLSMDRADLSPLEWILHLQEELGDGLQYAERIKGAIRLLMRAALIIAGMPGAAARKWTRDFQAQFGQVTHEKTKMENEKEPKKTRAEMLESIKAARDKAQAILDDADHWNNSVRKVGEAPIVADPGGVISCMIVSYTEVLKREGVE